MSDTLRDQLLGLGFKPAPRPERERNPAPQQARKGGPRPGGAAHADKAHKPHKPHNPQKPHKPHKPAHQRNREDIDLDTSVTVITRSGVPVMSGF